MSSLAEAHLLPGSDQRAVVEVGVGVVFVRGYGVHYENLLHQVVEGEGLHLVAVQLAAFNNLAGPDAMNLAAAAPDGPASYAFGVHAGLAHLIKEQGEPGGAELDSAAYGLDGLVGLIGIILDLGHDYSSIIIFLCIKDSVPCHELVSGIDGDPYLVVADALALDGAVCAKHIAVEIVDLAENAVDVVADMFRGAVKDEAAVVDSAEYRAAAEELAALVERQAGILHGPVNYGTGVLGIPFRRGAVVVIRLTAYVEDVPCATALGGTKDDQIPGGDKLCKLFPGETARLAELAGVEQAVGLRRL